MIISLRHYHDRFTRKKGTKYIKKNAGNKFIITMFRAMYSTDLHIIWMEHTYMIRNFIQLQTGGQVCCSCNLSKTIQNDFFDCILLNLFGEVDFDINPSISSFSHMSRNWLNGINNKLKYHILVGISALPWAKCLCCNDVF